MAKPTKRAVRQSKTGHLQSLALYLVLSEEFDLTRSMSMLNFIGRRVYFVDHRSTLSKQLRVKLKIVSYLTHQLDYYET